MNQQHLEEVAPLLFGQTKAKSPSSDLGRMAEFELARKRSHSAGQYTAVSCADDEDLEDNNDNANIMSTTTHQNKQAPFHQRLKFRLSELFGCSQDIPDSHPTNGRWSTVFLLLNSMIGSGILNQPQVFAKAGILGGILLYLICCITMWLAQQKLLCAGIMAKKMDYSALARHCFGRFGGVWFDGAVLLGGVLALCSYLTVIGGEGVAIINDWIGTQGAVPATVALPVVVVFFLLPLCMVREFGHLAFVSVLSMVAIALVMWSVVLLGPSASQGEGQGRSAGSGAPPLLWFSWAGVLEKLGSVLFAFDALVATFFAYQSMEQKSTREWEKVTGISMLVGCLMCALTGISGYYSFRDETQGDILDNFSGPFFDVVKFMVVLHLILYVPITFVVMRHSFAKLVLGKDVMEMSNISYTALTCALLGAPFLLVMILFWANVSEGDAFGKILDVTGDFNDGSIALIFPGLLYMSKAHELSSPGTSFTTNLLVHLKTACYLVVFGALCVFIPVVEELSSHSTT